MLTPATLAPGPTTRCTPRSTPPVGGLPAQLRGAGPGLRRDPVAMPPGEAYRSLGRALGEVLREREAPGQRRAVLAQRILERQNDLCRAAVEQRLHGLGRMQAALVSVSGCCSASELIARASSALREVCDVAEVTLSAVEGSRWMPADSITGPGSTDLEPALLRGALLEAEAVRRRVALLVRDVRSEPRVNSAFIRATGLASYVVVPVVVADRVVGLLHLGNPAGRRVLDEQDRALASAFTAALSRLYEHARRREALAEQRKQLTLALADVDLPLRSGAVDVVLARAEPVCADVRPMPAQAEGWLTAREAEVLDLMAQGATNLQIALRLVVSESTVKSHVKRILRKLGAASRAEAVSLHLRRPSRAATA